MLYEIMRHCRNFFVVDRKHGTFNIIDGKLDLQIEEGQHFMLEGSKLNTGVYTSPTPLRDETFTGAVVIMSPPEEFMRLVSDIQKYQESEVAGPYISESGGGFSRTKATGKNGTPAGWTDIFATRLNVWRKI